MSLRRSKLKPCCSIILNPIGVDAYQRKCAEVERQKRDDPNHRLRHTGECETCEDDEDESDVDECLFIFVDAFI